MRKRLIKPDNHKLISMWTIGSGMNEEVLRKEEVNFTVPEVLAKQKKRGPVILQINPEIPERVKLFGEPVELTDLEFKMLYCLAKHPGKPITGRRVYLEMYSEDSEVSDDQLYVTKFRLLEKLQNKLGKKRIRFNFISIVPKEGLILNCSLGKYRFGSEESALGGLAKPARIRIC